MSESSGAQNGHIDAAAAATAAAAAAAEPREEPSAGPEKMQAVRDARSPRGAQMREAPAAGPEAQAAAHVRRREFGIDGVSGFLGMRWDDTQTVRLTIRPELINAGGMLSGVVTFGLVDYCMGSTLWTQTAAQERIATVNISINYVQTALEGDVICTTELDRRNRSTAVMRSEVRDEQGRLLVTAIGTYAIFVPRSARTAAAQSSPPAADTP